MLFSWLKKRRRRKLLAEPFPPFWQAVLDQDVAHFRMLPAEQQDRLRDVLRIIIAEKDWEGCNGLAITEQIQVTVAALAGLMTIGWDNFYFDDVQTILIYPKAFKVRRRQGLGGEAFLEGDDALIGEAAYSGPIVLAWPEVEEAARKPGYAENLVFHEFAHKLDMLNGYVDGIPPLPGPLHKRWEKILRQEYDDLCAQADGGTRTLLDPYGATNEAEFFAVATEAFFDLPIEMAQEHAELYGVMSEFYKQDPREWFRGGERET